jgi:hypothetical protein
MVTAEVKNGERPGDVTMPCKTCPALQKLRAADPAPFRQVRARLTTGTIQLDGGFDLM